MDINNSYVKYSQQLMPVLETVLTLADYFADDIEETVPPNCTLITTRKKDLFYYKLFSCLDANSDLMYVSVNGYLY